jgi:hypothetical protein
VSALWSGSEGFNRIAREGHALVVRLRVLDGLIALGVGKSEMARQGLVGRGFMAGADLVWIGRVWAGSGQTAVEKPAGKSGRVIGSEARAVIDSKSDGRGPVGGS